MECGFRNQFRHYAQVRELRSGLGRLIVQMQRKWFLLATLAHTVLSTQTRITPTTITAWLSASVCAYSSGSAGQWGVRSFSEVGRTTSVTTKGSSLGTEPQYARDCVAFGICYDKAAQVRAHSGG